MRLKDNDWYRELFDRPSFRALQEIVIVHLEDYTALTHRECACSMMQTTLGKA